jgi:hypothetical protein
MMTKGVERPLLYFLIGMAVALLPSVAMADGFQVKIEPPGPGFWILLITLFVVLPFLAELILTLCLYGLVGLLRRLVRRLLRVRCPHCETVVSRRDATCPHCGCAMKP